MENEFSQFLLGTHQVISLDLNMSADQLRTFMETLSDIRTSQVVDFLSSTLMNLFQILSITLFKLSVVVGFQIFTSRVLSFDFQLFSPFSRASVKDVNINDEYSDYISDAVGDYSSYPLYSSYDYQGYNQKYGIPGQRYTEDPMKNKININPNHKYQAK